MQDAQRSDSSLTTAVSSSGRKRVRSRWEWPIVIGLLLIAFFFRVWMLNDVPPGLHHDEVIIGQVAQGYSARSLRHLLHGGLRARAVVSLPRGGDVWRDRRECVCAAPDLGLHCDVGTGGDLRFGAAHLFAGRCHRHAGVDVDLTVARVLRARWPARDYAAVAHHVDGVLSVESAVWTK